MSVLGIELSDAGITVAGGDPPSLLKIDGDSVESPGFALPESNRLIVGATAERKAHLYPRQILNHFWDHLNTEPLDQPISFAHNHAEIAFEHFAHIWQKVKQHGTETIIAVPGFYTHQHLGLLLGITKELSIPVKGFVPLAIAAVPDQLPKGFLLHVDLHLHRFEITYLQPKSQLSIADSISVEGSGLSAIYRRWVDAIAEEFVRHTRFDPLHQAATEQELYDRLPGVLAQLSQNPNMHFEMTGGSKVYHVTLTTDHFYKVAAPEFEEIRRLIDRFCNRYGKNTSGRVLMLGHRLARLPGIQNALAGIDNCSVIALQSGSGALGALGFYDILRRQNKDDSAPFLTTRPLPREEKIPLTAPQKSAQTRQRPTHILYRNLAYPINDQPLTIGLAAVKKTFGIQIQGQIAGVSRKHCSVQLRGNTVVLSDHSTYGTYVNEKPVAGEMKLELGQVIRVGTPGEKLKLIACLDTASNET